jgi:hypothetical protein
MHGRGWGYLKMKTKILFTFLIFFLILTPLLFAADSVNILGTQIPLIDGAKHVSEREISNAKVETFVADKPVSEVVSFYSSYLKVNGFLIIAGEDSAGFNASVKKDATMFTLKIYPENQKTVIQFIR